MTDLLYNLSRCQVSYHYAPCLVWLVVYLGTLGHRLPGRLCFNRDDTELLIKVHTSLLVLNNSQRLLCVYVFNYITKLFIFGTHYDNPQMPWT